MPLFDYRCPLCKKTVEVRRGINDPEIPPSCEGHEAPVEMERVPSAPAAVVFKGTGFHAVDYPRRA